MDRICPKCGKDYSLDPYWSTSLKRHMNRKKTCIITCKTIISKGPEAHDLSHIGLDFDGSKLVPALTQIFDKYNSVCQPNTSRDVITYYLNGKVHHSSLAHFIYRIWYDFLIPRVFPILKERGWDYKDNGFIYDVTSPSMPKSLSIGRYQESEYFTSSYFVYVEQSKFYPLLRNKLSEYFKEVPKQRRSEIKALLLSQAYRLRT